MGTWDIVSVIMSTDLNKNTISFLSYPTMWKKIKRETKRVGKQVEKEVSRTSKRVEKEVRRTRDRVIKEAKRVSVQAEKVMHQVQERMKDPRIRALAADTVKSFIRGKLDLQSIALCVS